MPFVEGRTYRASEPINPNSRAAAEQSDSPQPLVEEDFEPSHTIFQPEVDGDDDTGAQSQPDVTEGGEEDESQHSMSRSGTHTRGYAAQYPYYQTTSEGQAPSGGQTGSVQSGSYTSSGGRRYPSGSEVLTRRRVQTYGSSTGTGTGYQRNPQRRVVTYSGGSGDGSPNPGYQTQSQTRLVAYGSGGSNTGTQGSGYRPRTSVNRYGQTTSHSQGYVSSRVAGRQYGGSSIRYENGRYYDSAGHEVDPHGRHRDESGRLVSSSSNTDGTTQQGVPVTYDPIISQVSNDPVSISPVFSRR